MVATVDKDLTAFASRWLDDVAMPYPMEDACYEKVREQGAERTRTVQIAVGVDAEDQCHMLAVETHNHWISGKRNLTSRTGLIKGSESATQK